MPTGWSLESSTCTGGTDTDPALNGITVNIQAGDNVTCTFTNNKDASLTVVKSASPASDQVFSTQRRR